MPLTRLARSDGFGRVCERKIGISKLRSVILVSHFCRGPISKMAANFKKSFKSGVNTFMIAVPKVSGSKKNGGLAQFRRIGA